MNQVFFVFQQRFGNTERLVELAEGKTIAEVGDALDGDVLGEDPVASFRQSAGPACDVFAQPDPAL